MFSSVIAEPRSPLPADLSMPDTLDEPPDHISNPLQPIDRTPEQENSMTRVEDWSKSALGREAKRLSVWSWDK